MGSLRTNGAPAMIGYRSGFVAITSSYPMCTIVHIESHWVLSNLAKQILTRYTMSTFVHVVNFTSTITKFKNFCLKV